MVNVRTGIRLVLHLVHTVLLHGVATDADADPKSKIFIPAPVRNIYLILSTFNLSFKNLIIQQMI